MRMTRGSKIKERVFRGGGGLTDMDQQKTSKKINSVKSSMVKAGRRTIFFDVNVAANDKKYLKITESRFVGEGDETVRNSLLLFEEDARSFQDNLKEMIGYLN